MLSIRWQQNCLLDKIIFTKQFSFSWIALFIQRTSTNKTSNTFRMPEMIKNIGQILILNRLWTTKTWTRWCWLHTKEKTVILQTWAFFSSFLPSTCRSSAIIYRWKCYRWTSTLLLHVCKEEKKHEMRNSFPLVWTMSSAIVSMTGDWTMNRPMKWSREK